MLYGVVTVTPEGIFKEFKDLIRTQLIMQMRIGNGFCGI